MALAATIAVGALLIGRDAHGNSGRTSVCGEGHARSRVLTDMELDLPELAAECPTARGYFGF